jgi:cytochrome c-type biogenesis protein CcmF
MAIVGRSLMMIALAVSVWGLVSTIVGIRSGRRELLISGERSMAVLTGLVLGAFAILEIAFLRDDFSFAVVAGHSSTTTPVGYKAAAAWSSQEGSLLLWVVLLTIWSTIAIAALRKRLKEVLPVATVVLFGLSTFFLLLIVALEDPFVTLAQVPAEGAGLNPLLRHASMMIHPPALYAGYTLFSIPFAFAIGALWTRRLGADWLLATRRFALGAWLALGIGILLGARWSYAELGWGGYWAWDAVENAALLPWLLGTAYLHSATIQEKRGMLKIWNASLVLGAGILSILGTFLVRSGILTSIHAFVEPGAALRWAFVALILVELGASIYLVVTRRSDLRSEHRLDSLLSRESFFLGQNLILVALTFVVMWGTFFPLISEAVTGTKSTVGPEWFDRYVGPLALVMVALMGIGPLVAWRRSGFRELLGSLRIPLIVALGTGVILSVAIPPIRKDIPSLLLFIAAALTGATVTQEFVRGVRARRAMASESSGRALVQLVRRNRRRYGGYVVHAGFALLLCGVAASSAFQKVTEQPMTPGTTVKQGDYTFTYVKPTAQIFEERVQFGAEVAVTRNGKDQGTINPTKSWYPANLAPTVGDAFSGESETDVGLRAGPLRDLWIAIEPDTSKIVPLAERVDKRFGDLTPEARAVGIGLITAQYLKNPPPATFRIIVSPLVTWIWAGGIVVVIGGLIAIWPPSEPRRRRVSLPAAVGRGQG